MRFFGIAVTAAVGVALVGCAAGGRSTTESSSGPAAPAQESVVPAGAPSQAIVQVRGLSCPLCAHNVDSMLRRLPGVTDVQVDLQRGRVTAGLLRGKSPSAEALRTAIEDGGFSVDGVTFQ